MSANTSIEWSDRSWNPIRGCSRVSPGCDRCYAMLFAHRFSGPGKPYDGLTTIRRGKVDWTGTARLIPKDLEAPLHWRKPSRIFVNSMSDLFHHSLSDYDIDAVFEVMGACDDAGLGHTFQVLTKRAERARDYTRSGRARKAWNSRRMNRSAWPARNLHLGVSVENQKAAIDRLDALLDSQAALFWVSAEPLIERIDLTQWLHDSTCFRGGTDRGGPCICSEPREAHVEWVVCGGESGPGARPFDLAWAVDLRKQCAAARVPFFFKQAGSKPESSITLQRFHLRHRKGADLSELPEGLRVREFPGAR